MNFSDKFSAKNAAAAKAWAETEHKKKQRPILRPAEPKMGVCDKCKQEALLRPHRSKETELQDGAASFGLVIHYYCENCFPKSRRNMPTEPPPSARQVKNLLRGAKKNLR